jgi:glyoxylase-like metal-dependent hydrolase (beta-lactamase superfamily II)
MDPDQPVPGIFTISAPTPYAVGPSNCFLIDGPEPALVDCGFGSPEAESAVRAGLAAHGLKPGDLQTIVLTHHHFDHTAGLTWLRDGTTAGLTWLRDGTTAVVAGHPWTDFQLAPDSRQVEARHRFFVELYHYCGVPDPIINELKRDLAKRPAFEDFRPIDQPLHHGDTISLGGRSWAVFETPGHAGTSITLLRDDGTALVGDTLLSRISSNAIAEPPYPGQTGRTSSMLAYRSSLRLLHDLEISTVLPGHGPAFGDHRSLIERRLKGQDDRARRLSAGITAERDTVAALSEMLFPNLTGEQYFLGLSEVLGHLDILENQLVIGCSGNAPARYALI